MNLNFAELPQQPIPIPADEELTTTTHTSARAVTTSSNNANVPSQMPDLTNDKIQTFSAPPQLDTMNLNDNLNINANNTSSISSLVGRNSPTEIEQILDKVLTKLEQLQERKFDTKLPDGKYLI